MATKKLKEWFDKDLALLLAAKIKTQYTAFKVRRFVDQADQGVQKLELKGRVELIADFLHTNLPDDYPHAVQILTAILGPENEAETGMFTEGYWLMPVAKYVEKYGLDHFSESIAAIEEITKRHTGEYCIRPFLEQYPERTLNVMRKWSLEPNFHVRRLASEGVRPRLPWAKKLDQFIADPKPILPIMENLKDDPSRFVQKSVANNLNDILKDNYTIGMDILRRWAKDAPKDRQWVIKHALRNERKKKNPEAFEIIKEVVKKEGE